MYKYKNHLNARIKTHRLSTIDPRQKLTQNTNTWKKVCKKHYFQRKKKCVKSNRNCKKHLTKAIITTKICEQ